MDMIAELEEESNEKEKNRKESRENAPEEGA